MQYAPEFVVFSAKGKKYEKPEKTPQIWGRKREIPLTFAGKRFKMNMKQGVFVHDGRPLLEHIVLFLFGGSYQ